MSKIEKPWYEGRVQVNENGDLLVAKVLLTSELSGRILYLTCAPRHHHELGPRPDIPGGYADLGEPSLLAAAKRENTEETAIEPTEVIEDPIFVQSGVRSTQGLPIEISYFRFMVAGEPKAQLNSREHSASQWDELAAAPSIFGATPIGLGLRAIHEAGL